MLDIILVKWTIAFQRFSSLRRSPFFISALFITGPFSFSRCEGNGSSVSGTDVASKVFDLPFRVVE